MYILVPLKSAPMNDIPNQVTRYEIVIVADEHDYNYLTSINSITHEDLQKLMPLFLAIKANKQEFNYDTTGYIERIYEIYPDFVDEIDLLENFVPSNGNGVKRLMSVYYHPKCYKIKIL